MFTNSLPESLQRNKKKDTNILLNFKIEEPINFISSFCKQTPEMKKVVQQFF